MSPYAVAALHGDDICEDDIEQMIAWINHKAAEGYKLVSTVPLYGGALIFMEYMPLLYVSSAPLAAEEPHAAEPAQ